jgi:hypothetical protein
MVTSSKKENVSICPPNTLKPVHLKEISLEVFIPQALVFNQQILSYKIIKSVYPESSGKQKYC